MFLALASRLVVLLFIAVFVDWLAKTKIDSSSMTKMLPG